MFRIRRGGRESTRFLSERVGLFFLAAAIWGVGVRMHNERVTAAGLFVGIFGFVLGMYLRRQARDEEEEEGEA